MKFFSTAAFDLCFTIFQYFKVLIMITVCKSSDNEISLNFNSIYLILQLTLYSFLK
jgi:hypothetical protein